MMSNTEKEMWRINIENAVDAVCRIYGADVVKYVFYRYSATNFDDLSSGNYAYVFSDLELIGNGN